ncbi:MAG: hypothetical protein QOC93_2558 [Actinomycetota bacterium]|nr:hypothetical protein [Actinomycetota bacterium]
MSHRDPPREYPARRPGVGGGGPVTATGGRDTTTRPARGCGRCAAAWSVAADARMKQRAAEADAARARESERQVYAVAQQAFDQVEAARQEIRRMSVLLAAIRPHPDRAQARSERQGR